MVSKISITPELCTEVVERVRCWEYRPSSWSTFARDVLVILCGIRPVVLCDEVSFKICDWQVVEEFLWRVSEVSGVGVKGMVFRDEEWDVEGDMGVFYLVNEELMKVKQLDGQLDNWPVYIMSTKQGFTRIKDSNNIKIRVAGIITDISHKLECGSRALVDLNRVVGFKEMAAATTGWLLEYPVVYVHGSNCPSVDLGELTVPMEDRIVVRCCSENKIIATPKSRKAKIRVPQLFSFTIPKGLLSSQEFKDAVSVISTKLRTRVDRHMDVWNATSITTENAGNLAWAQ